MLNESLYRLGWYLKPPLSVECFVGGSSLDDDVVRLQDDNNRVSGFIKSEHI